MTDNNNKPLNTVKKAAVAAADQMKGMSEQVTEQAIKATKVVDNQFAQLRKFFKMESAGGITLMIAMIIALIFANTPLYDVYNSFLKAYLTVEINGFGIDKPLLYWINDGLMAIFFLLVGLEIKREVMEGELSSIDQALLPTVAAAGGVALPALIYVWYNSGDPIAEHGWAIPAATDIAFALGILALFGKRVPISLKIFLTAVAVIDDLAAIIIIAIFYTQNLSMEALFVATVCIALLLAMNLFRCRRMTAYVLVGIVMWVAVLKSGVHATLAGVILGLMIPHKVKEGHKYSMLEELEHGLHPWVAFMVLPIFAFANSGITFAGMKMEEVFAPIPLGIAFGLFFGKQIGIFSVSFLMIKTGLARLPSGANWRQFYGVCVLCGIGFTMSLFIGGLAFDSNLLEMETRIGVLMGSIASAIFGALLLHFSLPSAEELERKGAATPTPLDQA